MNQIRVEYIGDLRTQSVHLESNDKIVTDAPKDNQGLGRRFSPTDLVASALGSCLLTVMGIVAKRHKINMCSSYVDIQKHMSKSPRRISDLILNINLNEEILDNHKKILKRASAHCPVHNSLNENMKIKINFK